MQKPVIILFLFSVCSAFFLDSAQAQWGIGYHQSELPFVGISYTFAQKFTPELRIGTDRYFEDVSPEAVVTYQFLRREDYKLYAGLGIIIQESGGAVVPLGIRIFPFEKKKFGFHIEAAPIIGEGSGILRGSWGIRYLFMREE